MHFLTFNRKGYFLYPNIIILKRDLNISPKCVYKENYFCYKDVEYLM